MKYIITILFFALFSFEVQAGQYDGAWITAARPGEYFVVRHVAGTIAVIRLSEEYEIFLGALQNKAAHVETFKGAVTFKADINFISDLEATLTVQDCTPVEKCDFHPGTVLSFKKFF